METKVGSSTSSVAPDRIPGSAAAISRRAAAYALVRACVKYIFRLTPTTLAAIGPLRSSCRTNSFKCETGP